MNHSDKCTSLHTPDTQKLSRAIPQAAWIKPQETDIFQDGEQLLVAVAVCSRHNPQKWRYEYSVVTCKCDEHYFELECEGEAWGWTWSDIDFYVRL